MTDGRDWSELLARALEASTDAAAGSERDVAALLDVARRHRGQAFGLDPVAVDLVHAILEATFGRRQPDADPWRLVAQSVAQTMCGEPGFRERLQELWSGLQARVAP